MAEKAQAAKVKSTKVRARERGYYNGLLVEEGETFDNTLGLDTFPTDPHSWFEDAKKPEPDEA
ncbi:hypothetical protein [Variovorax sp. GT1P44]|uniref:hypothetical protein n=1 Tax=Variovorax sp. GT1P44 TaxID=3443742 RepID=UPI003F458F0D